MPPRSRHNLVSSDLILRLHKGEWKVGDKFPTVDELLNSYEFSRVTVFKGIQQLVEEGYLKVRKGIGTFVARTIPLQNIGLLINETCLEPQKTPFPFVLSQKLISSLEKDEYSVLRFIESKGNEFVKRFNIENLGKALKKRSLCGMIMFNCDFPMYMNKCFIWEEYKVPYVEIATYGKGGFRVDFDSESMLLIALRYFTEQKRKNIAIICGTEMLALIEKAMPFFPELCLKPEHIITISGSLSYEREGFELLSSLWKNKDCPDALLVTDDIVTKGVVQAALSLGIKIPDELLILHAANSETNVFYPVPMPKIEYSLHETVEKALNLLKYSIANPRAKGISEKISSSLVEVEVSKCAGELNVAWGN